MIKVIREVDKSELRKFMYNGFQSCADDKKLYKSMNDGSAINVFQMSAGTASQVVSQVHPDNLSELTACNAFARPGTISGVPAYIEGKSGSLKYKNQLINSVFGETFGVCLFQEQVMNLTEKLSPKTDDNKPVYSGNYARGLLKKLGKANKKQEDIDSWNKMAKDLEVNSKNLGIPSAEIKALIEDLVALANYSFNKSHALAYSMMAAWTLYLNVYFKKFYYPAVVEYAFAHEKETLSTLKSIRKSGFEVVEPNLINSKSRTFVNNNKLIIGLHNLKQVGNSADNICKQIPYESFKDFMRKNANDSSVNKRAVTALVEFGCFDKLEPSLNRRQLISCFNLFWENKPTVKKITLEEAEKLKENPAFMAKAVEAFKNKVEQMLLVWDNYKSAIGSNEFAPTVDQEFLKECEYKYLGFNFFVTPFSKDINNLIDDKISKGICLESFDTLRQYKNISKAVPVFIKSVREYKDKNGNDMCFMTLEDRTNDECIVPVFASAYPFVSDKVASGVIAFMLLYNTDDAYRGGEQIMLGTKKWQEPSKFSSFIIPIKRII